MSVDSRRKLIAELQELRKSSIVTHITSDRRYIQGQPILLGLNTKLGTEAQPFFYKCLRELGKKPKLDLFLYTIGGQTDSVWPLVSIFREYSNEFNVFAPYKVHSAGTLICLGADTIVMGEAGELSPVDPKTGNQFNPIDDIDKHNRRAISVEDVTSYFDLAKDPSKDLEDNQGNTSQVDINKAFQILSDQVHPLALGNVNRSHKQIRELARRLLRIRSDGNQDENEKRISSIVNALTQGRYSHTDILNRKEAKILLGENMVRFPSDEEQALISSLLDEYFDALSLLDTFILEKEISDNPQTEITLVGGFIETEKSSYIFKSKTRIHQRSSIPPNYQLNIQPGQKIPIIPGFPKEYNFEIMESGWILNQEGI